MTTGLVVGAGLAHGVGARADEKAVWDSEEWDPGRPFLVVGEALRVQPVLMYRDRKSVV